MTLSELLAAADDAAEEHLYLYRNLISFPTVNTGVMPTGHEMACAEFIAAQLDHEGARAEVIESAPRRGNVVARLKGTGGGRSLLLASHLDVVPPGDEERWSHRPFDPVVRDGWVHGRGSNDCKGLVAPEVMALMLLARHRVRLRGDVLLACAADEEAGGAYGFGYLADQHPEHLRADLAVNEGGGAMCRLADGGLGCLVAVGEKGRHEATIIFQGESNHAAVPWLARNPLETLAEVIVRLFEYRPAVEHDNAALATTAELWGESPRSVEELEDLLIRQGRRYPAEADRYRALSRMTWAPTVVRGGEKSNAIPDRVELRVDVRTLPGQSADYALGELSAALADLPGVSVRLETTAEASASALTPEIEQAFVASLAGAGYPGTRILPTWCSGFTDSRLIRPLGVPVFGFAPIPPEIDLARCGCHNIDEAFPIAAVQNRLRALLALAWEWCG